MSGEAIQFTDREIALLRRCYNVTASEALLLIAGRQCGGFTDADFDALERKLGFGASGVRDRAGQLNP